MKLAKYVVLIGAVCAAFTLQPAKADTFSFDLASANSDISPAFPGPYGDVVVNRTSTTQATITFTADVVGGNIYLFTDGSSAAVNVNATTFTITGLSGSNSGSGFTPGPLSVASPPGTNSADGFGKFNGVIDSFDSFTHSHDTISFIVTNTSGTWASASDVLTNNDTGFFAAAHIGVTSSPASADNSFLATGFAGNGPGTEHVPDSGTTAMLLGLGLSGLGFVRRFVKR